MKCCFSVTKMTDKSDLTALKCAKTVAQSGKPVPLMLLILCWQYHRTASVATQWIWSQNLLFVFPPSIFFFLSPYFFSGKQGLLKSMHGKMTHWWSFWDALIHALFGCTKFFLRNSTEITQNLQEVKAPQKDLTHGFKVHLGSGQDELPSRCWAEIL